MSYSLTHPCGDCAKQDKCNDRHFIQGGINGIHDVWPMDKGHLGAGTVIIDCCNKEEKAEG
jgi:hypothetical protein